MSKAKKARVLLNEVFDKNMVISHRFKTKVQASSIFSEYEIKAASDFMDIIHQSNSRAFKMKTGVVLDPISEHTKTMLNQMTHKILANQLYNNNAHLIAQVKNLKKITEKNTTIEARELMLKINKTCLPRAEYPFPKPQQGQSVEFTKGYSPKLISSYKKYLQKELDNDYDNLKKKLNTYLSAINVWDKNTKHLPKCDVKKDVKMLNFSPKKDYHGIEPLNNDPLFDLNVLKRFTKSGIKERRLQQMNMNNEIICMSHNGNGSGNENNSSEKRIQANINNVKFNTIDLVKKDSTDSIANKKKIINMSQSADNLLDKDSLGYNNNYHPSYKKHLPNINPQDKIIPQKLSFDGSDHNKYQGISYSSMNKTDTLPHNKLIFDRKALRNTMINDLTNNDLLSTKTRPVMKYVDEYSQNDNTNQRLEQAAKYLGKKSYSKQQLNLKLNHFLDNTQQHFLEKKSTITMDNYHKVQNIENPRTIYRSRAIKKSLHDQLTPLSIDITYQRLTKKLPL